MHSLVKQLSVLATLMATVVYESCANPRQATAITLDNTGNILQKRFSIAPTGGDQLGYAGWQQPAVIQALTGKGKVPSMLPQ
jgi:hypothetical protein